MEREELDRIKRILSELGGLQRTIQRDMDRFSTLVTELKDLLVDSTDMRRVLSNEERFFRDVVSRVRDLSLVRKVQRRLHRMEMEVRSEEQIERKAADDMTDVETKLSRLKKHLKNVGKNSGS